MKMLNLALSAEGLVPESLRPPALAGSHLSSCPDRQFPFCSHNSSESSATKGREESNGAGQ